MACHWGFAFGDFAALYRRNRGKRGDGIGENAEKARDGKENEKK